MAWNVFVKVFVDQDNANNRRGEKEQALSGCWGKLYVPLCEGVVMSVHRPTGGGSQYCTDGKRQAKQDTTVFKDQML